MKLLVVVGLAAGLTTCPATPTLTSFPDMNLSIKPDWAPSTRPPTPGETVTIGPDELAAKLREGDIAATNMKWGTTYVFTVYRVDSDSFGGRTSDDHKFKVLFSDISAVTVTRNKPAGQIVVEYLISGIAHPRVTGP